MPLPRDGAYSHGLPAVCSAGLHRPALRVRRPALRAAGSPCEYMWLSLQNSQGQCCCKLQCRYQLEASCPAVTWLASTQNNLARSSYAGCAQSIPFCAYVLYCSIRIRLFVLGAGVGEGKPRFGKSRSNSVPSRIHEGTEMCDRRAAPGRDPANRDGERTHPPWGDGHGPMRHATYRMLHHSPSPSPSATQPQSASPA